jgi:hypothetical protein
MEPQELRQPVDQKSWDVGSGQVDRLDRAGGVAANSNYVGEPQRCLLEDLLEGDACGPQSDVGGVLENLESTHGLNALMRVLPR